MVARWSSIGLWPAIVFSLTIPSEGAGQLIGPGSMVQAMEPTAPAVAGAVSTLSLSTTPNPSRYGQAVTLTASVTAGATGKVTFYDGAMVLGIAAVASGQAVMRTPMLPAGTRSLRAHYSGDASFAASDSAAVSQAVVAGTSLGVQKPVSIPLTNPAAQLVLGDLNGDGKIDIVVVNQYVSSVTILLGNGDTTFRPGVSYNTGGMAQLAVLGDFNGDGKTDLAVATFTGFSLLLGNGDGTLQAPAAIAAGPNSTPTGMVAADFNNDGKVDVALSSGTTYYVFLGNGDGTFQKTVSTTLSAGTNGVAAADLNSDGKTDLIVGMTGYVVLLLSNGDGTFQPPVNYSTVAYSPLLGVADFNQDGKIDLAVMTNLGVSQALTLLLGNGDGTFGPPTNIANYTGGRVEACDANGDGKTDLLLASAVLLGNGDGTFRDSGWGVSSGTISVAGDFNGDGITDILQTSPSGPSLILSPGGGGPDPTISATHALQFTRGQTGAVYTLTVTNAGGAPTSGTVLVTDTLPSGLTATAISGSGWTCDLGTLTCTRGDSLGPGASFPSITVTVNVATDAAKNVTNTASVSGGGDVNPANNTASDPTVNRLAVTVTLYANPNPAVLGRQVTFSVTVSAGPTGKVYFYDGASVLGAATLVSQGATISTTALAAGSHSIRAWYEGDATYGPASFVVTVTVNALSSYGFAAATDLGFDLRPYVVSGLGQVIAGDFNKDGKPDLAVSIAGYNSTLGGYWAVGILIGRGDGTFQTPAYYSVPFSGTGYLVAADFDLDGKLDLISIGSPDVMLLKGNGDGTFQSATRVASNSFGAVTCVVGDFNADGLPDLALGSQGTVSILLGNGNGTFQSGINTSGAFFANSLAAADFNRDGKADLVLGPASLDTVGVGIAVLLGNGDGTFQTVRTYSSGVYGYASYFSVAVADMNGDGKLDVVASYDSVVVFLGNDDGTFRAAAGSQYVNNSSVITVGDFDGDGKMDVAGGGINAVRFLLGNGDGTLRPPAYIPATIAPTWIAVADFNGDGRTDLAVVNSDAGTVTVFFGSAAPGLTITKTHSGKFTAGQTGALYRISTSNPGLMPVTGTVTVTDTLPAGLTATAISGTGWSCTLAPVQCMRSDGLAGNASYPDILVTAAVSASLTPSTINNVASVSSSAGTSSATDPTAIVRPSTTSLAALPNPAVLGQAMMLTATITAGATGKVTFYDGAAVLGSATVSGTQAVWTTTLLPAGAHSLRAVYNGDTAYAISQSAALPVTVNANPASGVTAPANYTAAGGPWAIATSDFNRDGKTDLAVANAEANSVSIFLANGDGTFQGKVDYPVGTKPVALAVADFNGDGKSDLAVVNQNDNSFSILLGTGTGTFLAPVNYGIASPTPYSVLVGDFNGDGRSDLAVTVFAGVLIYLGNGDGTFQAPLSAPLTQNTVVMAAGDFDGDGYTDLASLTNGYGSVYIMLGNGDGTFRLPNPYLYFINGGVTGAITVADVNGDGKADVIAGIGNSVFVLLGKGDGTFYNPVSYGAGTNIASVVATDLNGDGKLDVLTANSGSNNISVLLGNGNGTFQSQVTYTVGTEPRALVAGDFNGDGRTDLAVANHGSNNVSVLLAPVPSCPPTLDKTVINISDAPINVYLTLTATSSCAWVAQSNVPWVNMQVDSLGQAFPTLNSTGYGILNLQIRRNTSSQARQGTLVVNGNGVIINQAGSTDPTNLRYIYVIFNNFLAREPGAAGINFFLPLLNSGQLTRTLMAYNMFTTAAPEFNAIERFVIGLYYGILGRDPDYFGWDFHRRNLHLAVVTQDTLVTQFLATPEFISKYGPLTNTQFVTLIYQNALSRSPSAADLSMWTTGLANGTWTRTQVVQAILNSNEFVTGASNRQTVFLLHATMLSREPGDVGYSAWLGYLNSPGSSLYAAVNAFVVSPEFQAKLGPN